MQKYKIWIIAAVLIIGLGGLILWLAPKGLITPEKNTEQNEQVLNHDANMLQNAGQQKGIFASNSQQDTEINCQMLLDANQRLIVNEATRNCFEYFITQYGEKEIQQIEQDFKTYISQNHQEPALGQILDLWKRYMQYRQSLGELNVPAGANQDDPAYYRSIYNSTQDLRKKFFSNYEIEGLFGTEDTYHEYTLDRMSIMADKKLSEAEKAKKLKDLFSQLPQDWQENLEQINKLDDLRKLTAEIKARGGSAEEIRNMRLNLVGPEATQRLETLDGDRASWKSSVNTYLAERDSILQSGMSDNAKQQAIQQLKNQHFSQPEEQLRLDTFEQVHDQGGKLPFPD